MEITSVALREHLLGLKGATPITFTATTDTRAKAKGNPFARPIWKTNRVNGLVNFHYDQGVIRRLEKEGKSIDVFRQGTSWHTPIILNGSLTPLCISKNPNNPKFYVRFMFRNRIGDPTYTDKHGKSLTYEEIKPWLDEPSTYENQGLHEPLIFLTYSLQGISQITVASQEFEIKDALAIAS